MGRWSHLLILAQGRGDLDMYQPLPLEKYFPLNPWRLNLLTPSLNIVRFQNTIIYTLIYLNFVRNKLSVVGYLFIFLFILWKIILIQELIEIRLRMVEMKWKSKYKRRKKLNSCMAGRAVFARPCMSINQQPEHAYKVARLAVHFCIAVRTLLIDFEGLFIHKL